MRGMSRKTVQPNHANEPALDDGYTPTLNDRQEAFLELVEASGARDCDVAEAVGLNRWTVWHWKKTNPEFWARYKASRKISLEHLVREAERRAINGSDRLLEFLLCNYAPEKFSNRQKLEHSVGDDLVERLAAARRRTAKPEEDDGSDLAG